jgi:hypothetical protein
MAKAVLGILGRLTVVLALMLGGLSPASPGHSLSAMAMMPGMAMHHEMGQKAPGKHMPCCDQSGCCVAGPCGTALPLQTAGLIARMGFASAMGFDNATGPGTRFPPSFRPPIAARAFS